MRLFLTEDGYQAALQSQQRREIKIKRYARVIEGHILDKSRIFVLGDTEEELQTLQKYLTETPRIPIQ